MAERGKTEESQRTEGPARVSDAEMQEVVDHIQAVFGESAHVQFSYSIPAAAGVPRADVFVQAKPAQAKGTAEQARVETGPALPDIGESDEPVEVDDAYFDEVRRAVGRGVSSVFLGTSTKSLKQSFLRLKAVRQADIARATSSASAQRAKLSVPHAHLSALAAAVGHQKKQPEKD